VTREPDDRAELDDIIALLIAVGRPDPEPVAPLLVTYQRALGRWRELGRTVVDAHTWPAHVDGPVPRSDSR
jgi:hypothetical protein